MKEALKRPVYYRVIMYCIVTGLFSPSFGSFGYFFTMDVLGISKFTYSMLTVLGFVSLLAGTQLYRFWGKDYEYRSLILIDVLINLTLAPLSFILIFRLNVAWGIPDLSIIIFTELSNGILSQCLLGLPFSVLMAKICPRRVEATSFAMLATISSLKHPVSAWFGTWLNETYVGVTKDDMSNYWILVTISSACGLFYALSFLWLIPTKA